MQDSINASPSTPICPPVVDTQGRPSALTAYWRKQLAGLAPLQLPSDHPRVAFQAFRGATQSLALPEGLTEAVKALSEREGVTVFVVLLAALKTLLYRYTGQPDILVSSIGRVASPPEYGTSTSLLDKAVPLRTNLLGNPTFRELLARVQRVTSEACSRADGFFDLSRKEPQSAGLPSVIFTFQPEKVTPGSGLANSHTNGMKYELYVEVEERPEGMVLRLHYNADLFEPDTVARMARHWLTLVEGAVSDPTLRLSKLPVLSPTELHQLLVEWNDTSADYPAMCLHELIEAQVQRTPDAVAVIFEDRQLSYRELNARANQLAHYLRKLGVRPELLVGICVERSPELIIALLGVLKAGGAYVPLDPQYPTNRLSLMVEDSGLKTLVTQEALRRKFSEYQGQLVCLDSQSQAISAESAENEPGGARAEDLAYVIYTSGSTGKPKGVQIAHRSLVNFLFSMQSSPGLRAPDSLLAVTTVSFDIAALELYLPLTVGARVVLVSRESAADGHQLQEALARSAATVMQATPATWRLLLEAGWQGSKDLKVLCGGEALPRELACELLKRASSVWNMYGPTETTVWSAVCRLTSGDGPITVGRPIANTEIYVLDSHLQAVPVGVPGELYIGGDGVGRGYLHRPELTAEKFIPNPFKGQKHGAPLYRTGDLARRRPSGEIECLGRIDHQVKVRGFRIEPGEIETVLGEHPGLRQNVVVAREDGAGEKCLVAYVVAGSGSQPSAKELRDFLKEKLPEFMLPSQFVFLEGLPHTPNGKVDRRALPAPEQLEVAQKREYAAPRDMVERQLVKIWEQVLKIRPVGITDNFFELGGHSLVVAKLLRRIAQDFGIELSIAAIFEAPTVAQQASLLRNSTALPRSSAVVPIQPAGSRPPLFCIGFDTGPVFLPLARRLGSDQPLLCVGLTLSEASQLPLPYRMEDIAARLVKRVREVQPEGPYHLGGVCAGGLIAYEVASQLMGQGQQVALLALFEPQTPLSEGQSKLFRLDLLRQRLRFHLGNLQQLEAKEAPPYIWNRVRTLFARVRRLAWHACYDLRARMNDGHVRNLADILVLAAIAYRPLPYTGRTVLFRATRRGDWDLKFSWRDLAPRLQVHEIPGYHDTILLEPNVESLASRLGTCIREAQEARVEA